MSLSSETREVKPNSPTPSVDTTSMPLPQAHPTVPGLVLFVSVFLVLSAIPEAFGFMIFGDQPIAQVLTNTLDSTVFIVAKIAVGAGLFYLRPWARRAAIILLVARFLTGSFLSLFILSHWKVSEANNISQLIPQILNYDLPEFLPWKLLLTALIYGILIYFLSLKETKEAFGK